MPILSMPACLYFFNASFCLSMRIACEQSTNEKTTQIQFEPASNIFAGTFDRWLQACPIQQLSLPLEQSSSTIESRVFVCVCVCIERVSIMHRIVLEIETLEEETIPNAYYFCRMVYNLQLAETLHWMQAEANDRINTTDILQDNSYVCCQYTRISLMRNTHCTPLENESNRREHVFNCHLTVMNVSDQPSMVEIGKKRTEQKSHKHDQHNQPNEKRIHKSIKDIQNVFCFFFLSLHTNKKNGIQK